MENERLKKELIEVNSNLNARFAFEQQPTVPVPTSVPTTSPQSKPQQSTVTTAEALAQPPTAYIAPSRIT